MEPATLVTIVIVGAALLGISWLPLRKRWNDDGADDARRQAVEREMEHRRVAADADDERDLDTTGASGGSWR